MVLVHHSQVSILLTIAIIAFFILVSWIQKIGIAGGPVAITVGLSRIYVGVHFPFDIIGSFLSV